MNFANAFKTIKLNPLVRAVHSSPHSLARLIPLATRISRKANLKNQSKIAHLKAKLGQKYAIIGRDKRQSPFSERRSPSKPTQPLKKNIVEPLRQYLISPTHKRAKKLPKDITGILPKAVRARSVTKVDESVRMPAAETVRKTKQTNSQTLLRIPHLALPLPSSLPIEKVAGDGPGFMFNLTSSESRLVFQTTPGVMKKHLYGPSATNQIRQQAELVRRIVTLDNASQPRLKKFNIARAVEMFQRNDADTGSSEVQAATLTVRIIAIKDHLAKHRHDKSTKRRLQAIESKRAGMLKYLRRKVSGVYIGFGQVCADVSCSRRRPRYNQSITDIDAINIFHKSDCSLFRDMVDPFCQVLDVFAGDASN